MSKSAFRSLDDAVAHINEVKRTEAKPETPVEEESRWWSYTSKQNIIQEGEAVIRQVADHDVSSISGVHYQKCGGGRRVIRKNRRSY